MRGKPPGQLRRFSATVGEDQRVSIDPALLDQVEARGVAAADIREVVHRVALLKNDVTGESY